MEDIAQLLKETREESEIDLDEVSKDLDIDEVVLKNIEEGKIGLFKDIFVLKDYVFNYAKYLGLDSEKIIDEFNEYLFEYTSKIPVNEIEKTIKEQNKVDEKNELFSPYTIEKPKDKKWTYVLIYIILILLVLLAIFWSINQIAGEKTNTHIISYRRK